MITTDRLIIKKITQDRDGQLAKLLAEPTIQQGARLTFTNLHPTSFEVDFLLQTGDFYAIYGQEQPQIILGLLFTQPAELAKKPAVELGYLLAPASRGRGIMTEAVRGLADWLGQATLAITDQENLPSQGVLRRAGFQLVEQTASQMLWKKVPCSHR